MNWLGLIKPAAALNVAVFLMSLSIVVNEAQSFALQG